VRGELALKYSIDMHSLIKVQIHMASALGRWVLLVVMALV